MFELITVL